MKLRGLDGGLHSCSTLLLFVCLLVCFFVVKYFSRLHEVLMDLQHQQLKQLSDWLELTEGRIKKMMTQPLGPDLENIKQQIEEHKVSRFVLLKPW